MIRFASQVRAAFDFLSNQVRQMGKAYPIGCLHAATQRRAANERARLNVQAGNALEILLAA